MESKRIYFIVMPPGHGKSHNHSPSLGLYEADQLVGCRSTRQLSQLRDKAKQDRYWADYNMVWGQLLYERAPNGSIVMVPSAEVGCEAFGPAGYVCSLKLIMQVWVRNMADRPGGYFKHLTPYIMVEGNRKLFTFESNQELSRFLKSIV